MLDFFTEKGSEFSRLRVEDVIFCYDVDKTCKWVARLNMAKIEMAKLEAKFDKSEADKLKIIEIENKITAYKDTIE